MIRTLRLPAGIIEYELRRTDRKSIECRVSAQGAVVFAPIRTPVSDIDDFVAKRAGWILEAKARLSRQAEQARSRLDQRLTDGAPIPVEGTACALRLLPGRRKQAALKDGQLIVTGAESAEEARLIIREYLSALAAERFAARVRHYAPIIGKHPNRITVREQKTKWGSCSGKGNLNFNWKLIMAPPGALDYVVVHELCHMIHMNHSADFWNLVRQHMPDYKKWQDYLKKDFSAPI